MKDTTIIIVSIVGAILVLAMLKEICHTLIYVSKLRHETIADIVSTIVQSENYTIETNGISAEKLCGERKITYTNTKDYSVLNILHMIYVCLSKHLSHSEEG